MARAPRRPRRRRRTEIGSVELAYFLEEPMPPGTNAFYWLALDMATVRRDGALVEVREFWDALQEEVLEKWIEKRPGTRPRAWWRFELDRYPPPDQLQYLEEHGHLTDSEREVLGCARAHGSSRR